MTIQEIAEFGVCNFTTEQLKDIKLDLLQCVAQGRECEPLTFETLDLIDAELELRGEKA